MLSSGGLLGICSVINKIPLWCLVTFLRNDPWSCLKGTFIALHSVDHVLINDCPSILYDGLYWTC